MKTFSLIFLIVVIYVVFRVDVSVAGRSQNADQNSEDAEAISTIQKDELIIPTDGHSKPSLTTIGLRILGLDFDHQIVNRRPAKERRPRKKCSQDKPKDCKPLDTPCKEDSECCGNTDQGNVKNFCKRGEDNKDTCQKCKTAGDDCNKNSDCCPFLIKVASIEEFVSLNCKVPDYANQNKCCADVAQHCLGDHMCCKGTCETTDGKFPGVCTLGPDDCKKEGELCKSTAECCKKENTKIDCLGYSKDRKCTDKNKPDNDTVVSDGDFR